MYRKKSYIVARIFALIFILIMAAIVAVQTPFVQTKLSQKALVKIQTMFNGDISCEEISVLPSGALQIKNIVVLDAQPYINLDSDKNWAPVDTLCKIGKLTTTFSIGTIFNPETGIHLNRVTLEDGLLDLVIYTDENNKLTNNINKVFNLSTTLSDERPSPGPAVLEARKVKITNFNYRMKSYTKMPIPKNGIRFNDMDLLTDINARSIAIKGSKVYGICESMTAYEKHTGYQILDISGRVSAGYGKVQVDNFHFVDHYSNLNLRRYSMINPKPTSYSRFIEEILMEARFSETKKSSINLHTIYYFGGPFADEKFKFDVKGGHFKGYVNDFTVDDFDFYEHYTGAKGKIACTLIGLPDINKLNINAKAQKISLTKTLAGISPRLKTIVNLSAKGPINRLKVNANINSNQGSANLIADIRNLLDTRRNKDIKLSLDSKALNIGAFTNYYDLGPTTLNLKAEASLSPKNEIASVKLDSLNIAEVFFNGINLRGIKLIADYNSKNISAKINSKDPKILFDLSANAKINKQLDSIKLNLDGDIQKFDLAKLYLDTRSNNSSFSCGINCDLLSYKNLLDGDALISDLVLTTDEEVRNISDIEFKAYHNGLQHYELNSQILDAIIKGNATIADFTNDLIAITVGKELPALLNKDKEYKLGNSYELSLESHDTREICNYLIPGLYVSDSTKIHLSIKEDGALLANISSPRLAIDKTYIKNLDIQLDNLGGNLNLNAFGSELKLSNYTIEEPLISAFADNNEYNLSLSINDFIGPGSGAEIFAYGNLLRDEADMLVVKANPYNSHIDINSEESWVLNDCGIEIKAGEFFINDFNLSNDNQVINLDGAYSRFSSDTLSLHINNLDLAIVDNFITADKRLDIKGELNANAMLTSNPEQSPGMLSDINLTNLVLGGVDGGTITINSLLNDSGEAIELYLRQNIQERNAIAAAGSYFLNDGNLEFNSHFDGFPISLAQAFVQSIFSELDGGLNGNLKINGSFEDLKFASDSLALDNVHIALVPTGSSYNINGPLKLTNEGLFLEDISISDYKAGSGRLDGSLKFNNFSQFVLNSTLSFNNLNVVNLAAKNNSTLPIYGNVNASGNASIAGPFNALHITANVSTVNNGVVHIATSNSLTGKSSDLLTFTKGVVELDPYEELIKNINTKVKLQNDLIVQAQVNVHQGIATYIEMGGGSNASGASFNGDGRVNLTIRPSRSIMDINGDYIINEGSFQFTLPNILSKSFSIQQGSNISFGGDLMDTQLDINALYSLKTSLSTILTSTSDDLGTTRRKVDCGINISDRLRNPNINFSIDVPDLEPGTKSQVEAVLSTPDKVQKQFLALLVMGSFIPDENSGVVNSSSLLLSNATELMSSQLNSILQKLQIPLDIGLGYQTNKTGSNIFDVAISTQLFNNRLIIGGSVGNRRIGTTTTGDVVGDIDVQLKIDKAGKFRVNAFSHSADSYSSYLDNAQRNGLGVSYTFGPKRKDPSQEPAPKVISVK